MTLAEVPWNADTDPEDLPPKNRTKDRSARARVASWIRYRAEEPGITNIEVARRLGIAPGTLNAIIHRASIEGWLRFDDPMLKLEHELVPKIVRNLNEMLDERSEKITIEAAKGTLFPMFKESKGITETPQTAIAIKLELPDSGQVVTGTILGRAKLLPPDA